MHEQQAKTMSSGKAGGLQKVEVSKTKSSLDMMLGASPTKWAASEIITSSKQYRETEPKKKQGKLQTMRPARLPVKRQKYLLMSPIPLTGIVSFMRDFNQLLKIYSLSKFFREPLRRNENKAVLRVM